MTAFFFFSISTTGGRHVVDHTNTSLKIKKLMNRIETLGMGDFLNIAIHILVKWSVTSPLTIVMAMPARGPIIDIAVT